VTLVGRALVFAYGNHHGVPAAIGSFLIAHQAAAADAGPLVRAGEL
jgi:hypothetical protein